MSQAARVAGGVYTGPGHGRPSATRPNPLPSAAGGYCGEENHDDFPRVLMNACARRVRHHDRR
jgi:hypothetical protein